MGTPAGWREGAACVAALTFDVDAESAILAEGRHYAGHAMVMTHQAFGPRVGVPRILGMLADVGVRATFFVPGVTAERWPGTVAAILEAGHEVGHHSHSHRSAVDLGEDEQRRDFERALVALDACGVRPAGHRAAMWEASWLTPRLVAEHGLAYDSSLMDDDRPYLLGTPEGEIAELPPHWSLDDWEQYAFLPRPQIGAVIEAPEKALAVWLAELDGMRRHGGLFILTCHPFLSGRAGRVEALRTLVAAARERGDVTFATLGEIADRAAADPAVERRPLRPVDAGPEDVYPA